MKNIMLQRLSDKFNAIVDDVKFYIWLEREKCRRSFEYKYDILTSLSVLPVYVAEKSLKNWFSDAYADMRRGINQAADFIGMPYDPSFHRFYVSSFLGALLICPIMRSITSNAYKKLDPYGVFSTMIGLTAIEVLQPLDPVIAENVVRTFDTGDIITYGVACTLYAAGIWYAKQKDEKRLNARDENDLHLH